MLLLVLSGKINLGIYLPGVGVPLRRSRKSILKQHFPYYTQLTEAQKRTFEQRVQRFIYQKEFIPRQIPQVTEEMQVLIAACATQLTFGFPPNTLSYFKRILVYPTDYYSTISKRYHKGEVNPKLKIIVLSWRHFVEGYLHNDDGRNLGLHEMAHALRLERRIIQLQHGHKETALQKEWESLAQREIQLIRLGKSQMFREYAGTNAEEFFSVAVENFFERPQLFNEQMPDLYRNLALLLRQDPLTP
ncbi:hypothetical protein BFP72_14720 [Reichenbachiella sp. 5M10]|nr:hypothetical protein BFP72_14720 [Reichenbachiella sp. 5M10]